MERIRRGMWVLYQDKIAILNDFNIFKGEGEVHLVAPDGTTSLILMGIPLEELVQASHGHIPLARRPREEVSTRLGYFHERSSLRNLAAYIKRKIQP